MTSLGSMVAQAGEQDRVGHQVANHAKPALRLRRPASADRARCLDSAIGHNRLLDLESLNLPTLPAPASASAHLQSTPHTSVGDGADANLSLNPTLHSRASDKLAASAVLRGAASFSSGPIEGLSAGRREDRRTTERPSAASIGVCRTSDVGQPCKAIDSRVISRNPAHWVRQAVVASSLSSPTMSVTAADPGARGFSNMLAVHHAHDVRGDALAVDPFLDGCAGRECEGQSERSNNYFEHFEISEPMVGVNTA